MARKGSIESETVTEKVDWFVVSKPHILEIGPSKDTISINCITPLAVIFYTLDGKKPTVKNGKLYTGPFHYPESATIMAFAVLENWKDSEVDTLLHAIIPDSGLFVNNKNAGDLPSSITYAQKLATVSLTISGEINGTDIKFIREMINDGKLAYLDISNASIVEGGEAYYSSYNSYYTENNVIGEWMFYNCKELVSLKLPTNATLIKGWAIDNCKNLKILELPSACRKIEDYAISGSNVMETLLIPENVKDFSGNNLTSCPRLEAVIVNARNTAYLSIDGVLFKNDGTLVKYPMGKKDASYSIPISVKKIGKNAFAYAKIEEINIAESVESIESSAFTNCSNLKNIVIPNSVISVGYMAFYDCKNLSEVAMSSNVTALESMVFSGCKSIREYTIGKNIKSIDDNSFGNCTSLMRFNVDEDNEIYAEENGILYYKDMNTLKRCPIALYLETMRIPDGVVTIASKAFDGCVNIGSFILPSTLKIIESSAFSNCKMTSINIPESVTSIDLWLSMDAKTLRHSSYQKRLRQ